MRITTLNVSPLRPLRYHVRCRIPNFEITKSYLLSVITVLFEEAFGIVVTTHFGNCGLGTRWPCCTPPNAGTTTSHLLLIIHLDVWSNWALSGDINYIIPVFHKNKKISNVGINATLRRVHVTIVTVEKNKYFSMQSAYAVLY